jgi:predicted nucleotidyltransferase
MFEALKKTAAHSDAALFGWLFGSQIVGGATPRSDVDVAVYFKPGTDVYEEALAFHHGLERALARPVDMVVLNRAKNLFLIEAILKEGVLIKDADPQARLDYELAMQHQVLDYKAFKASLNAA